MLEAIGIGGDGDLVRYQKRRGSEQTERLQWFTTAMAILGEVTSRGRVKRDVKQSIAMERKLKMMWT
jgi:hypothetical protein